MNRRQVLTALRTIDDLPKTPHNKQNFRTIYETGDAKGRGTGRFAIDYASFPGGTAEEVPIQIILELERDGLIRRAYPDRQAVKAWVLA